MGRLFAEQCLRESSSEGAIPRFGSEKRKSNIVDAQRLDFGGAEGNRTPDLCSAIAALSHLSYGPTVESRAI
jgi:hypothetical protein